MPIINGRRVDLNQVPNSGVYGREMIREISAGANRRPVIQDGLVFKPIDPNRRYEVKDLKNKKGQGVTVTSIPDRTKGGFGGYRDASSRRIIREQVYAVAEHIFKQGVDFDEETANWMVVPNYRLPKRWHDLAGSTTALMVVFPDEYPILPPVGFYMMADIPASPDGHFYDEAYHQAWREPIKHGWKWYCVYINEGAWQPAQMWREGDNLYTYFTLISEVLTSEG